MKETKNKDQTFGYGLVSHLDVFPFIAFGFNIRKDILYPNIDQEP